MEIKKLLHSKILCIIIPTGKGAKNSTISVIFWYLFLRARIEPRTIPITPKRFCACIENRLGAIGAVCGESHDCLTYCVVYSMLNCV